MALIGISGKAGSAKNTFSDFLVTALKEETGEDYVTIAYADILKHKVMKDFGLSREQVYGEDKEKADFRYPRHKKQANFEDGKLWKDEDLYWTGRQIMQFVGTDCYRAIDNNFWIKALFNYIEENKLENVIVTDCRFKNEVDAVVDRDGYHIKIVRPGKTVAVGADHISEVDLDEDYKVDFKVVNNSSLEHLEIISKEVATIIKVLKNNK